MKLQKTIKIKLRPTTEQTKKMDILIDEYVKAANFITKEISKIQENYKESNTTSGICSKCGKSINYRKYKMKIKGVDLFCLTCFKKEYSQYTIQKVNFQEKIGIRNISKMPKSYYANAIRFVSDTFTGFDEIKKKKERKFVQLNERLDFWKGLLEKPEKRNEKLFRVMKYAPITDMRENPHYYSEAEIKAKIKHLEKKLRKFKMPKYPDFKNKTISLQKELYSWKKPNELKISSITEKNEFIDYFGKEYLNNYIDIINKQNPVILLKKEGDSLYLCFPISKTIDIPKPDKSFEPVGIDWGITRNIAVLTILSKDKKNKFVKFYPAGRLLTKRKHYKSLRKHFGNKKRLDKIIELGKKEDRFIDRNVHKIAFEIIKDIKENSKKPVILMEKITDNREEAAKFMRQNVLLHSVKSRLQNYIAYKALWEGISVNLVPSEFTSQTCNKCGNQDRKNRPQGSKLFKCTKCNYSCNSDYNASVNIAKKLYTEEFEPFTTNGDEKMIA